MTFDPNALKLYTDGSCKPKNPGPGGWAIWAEYPDGWNKPDEFLTSRGYYLTTNNRMELWGVISAYDWIEEQGNNIRVARIQIITDSTYVHDHLSFATRWRANDWCNADGRPMANVDLWKKVLNRRNSGPRRTIHVVRTDGKKSPILKEVDRSAREAAGLPTETDYGYAPGKVGRTDVKVRGVASLFPAANQTGSIRIFFTTVAKGGANIIKFQTLDDPTGLYVEKFVAYASPEIGHQLHRQHRYLVRFNGNPKYPQIVEIVEEITSAEIETVF
jgi:ribonuclease HI